jgi:hypothetical protein
MAKGKYWLGKTRPPFSKKWRKKISESVKKNPTRYWLGKKRGKRTEEAKRKTSEALIGIKKSKKTRIKMSKTWKKIRAIIPAKTGKDSPNWRGGTSYEPYSIDWTKTLKRSIRERDKYICQKCYKQQTERTFAVHHIDRNKKNCNPKNLVTLCHSCHAKSHKKVYGI